ncbi:hypothetical protein GX408_14670 [bacterium]|nr:hypothetical protein [bacterium]
MRTRTLLSSLTVLFFAVTIGGAGTQTVNVRDYGAVGDATTKDTAALQRAIDACSRQGGGTVYLPNGCYLSGSLHLKSQVALYLDHGAQLLASPDDTDFDPYEKLPYANAADHETSFFHFSLIWGEDLERIAILGTGVIDGNRSRRGGPKPIALKRCRNIILRDVTIRNAPNYAISLLGCDHVLIDGVAVRNGYCDGIDPDASRFVQISRCYIESRDDAIVPKASFSLGVRRDTEYLTVSDCILVTACNGFKLGTESGGDFKHIAVSNCILRRHPEWRVPTSGIALESVDGSRLESVSITNFIMDQVHCPIFLRLGNRGRDQATPSPGCLRNIIIDNIIAGEAQQACLLTGIPDHPLEAISLSRLNLTYRGGSREQADIAVPELIDAYPSPDKFGDLPAVAVYARHVRGLDLDHVRVSLLAPDSRPAFYGQDIVELNVEGLNVQSAAAAEPLLRLINVRQALIQASGIWAAGEAGWVQQDSMCSDIMVKP